MNKLVSGMLAGLIATVVLSVLMVIKGMMGMMPDVNVIKMLAGQMNSSASMGWVAHFMIGVIGYGIIYAVLFANKTTNKNVQNGILLAVIGWLLMMVVLMPMMGAGLFGLQMPSGVMVPVATFILHLIFGATLGLSYAKLSNK